MLSRRPRSRWILASAVVGFQWFTAVVEADIVTWSAAAGPDTVWTTAANWDSQTLPDSGDDVVFAIAGSTSTLDSPQTVGQVTFIRDDAFTIHGAAALTINLGIDAAAPAAGAGQTYNISAPVILGANNLWDVRSVTAPTTLNVSGTISGAFGVDKAGAGTLVLGDVANTYTGPTTIRGGVVRVSTLGDGEVSSSIGASTSEAGNLVLSGGGLLQYGGGAVTTNRNYTLGDGGGGFDASGSGGLGISGHMIASSASGTHSFILTGTSTFSNAIGGIIGNGPGSTTNVVKNGTGRWVLANPNNFYSGSTLINGGVLEIQSAGSTIGSGIYPLGNSTNIVLNDGGTLRYNYTGTFVPGAGSGDPAHDAGSVGLLLRLGAGASAVEVTGNGPLNFGNNGTLLFDGVGPRTLTLGGTYFDPLDGSDLYCALRAIIADGPGGPTSLIKDGPGEWAINGVNTYTGPTFVNDGTLLLAHADTEGNRTFVNVLPPTTAVTIGPTGELELYTGDNEHVPEPLVQTIHSIAGSGTITLNAGTLTINNPATNVYSGVIRDTQLDGTYQHQTGGNLTKSGPGLLVLLGANSYTGLTTISSGTLQIGDGGTAGSLGSGSVLNNSGLVINRADLHTVTNQVSGTGNLEHIGTGTTILSGTSGLSGTTMITRGTLVVGGGSLGALSATSSVTVKLDGMLKIDNGSGANDDRLPDGVGIALHGSSLQFIGAANDDAELRSDETIGQLAMELGASTLTLAGSVGTGIKGSLTLGGAAFVRQPGATLRFVDSPAAEVKVTSFGETNGIIGGWMLYDESNFAALSGQDTGSVEAASGYLADLELADVMHNVRLTTALLPTLSRTINSLTLFGDTAGKVTILAGHGLTINSGGLILNATAATAHKTIEGLGTLTVGAANELIIHATGIPTTSAPHTIASPIVDNGAPVSLTKSGASVLALAGDNTYTGRTYIIGGVLSVGSLANGGTTSHIGSSSSLAENLLISGATLRYIGPTTSTDRLFTIGPAGATIDARDSTGSLSFTNTATLGFIGNGPRSLTLVSAGTYEHSLAARIGNAGAGSPTSIIKAGPGSWTLAGTLGFSGALVINEGTLAIGRPAEPNDPGGAAAVSALSIAGGATPTATLDLTNNCIVIDYSGDSPLATVRAQIGHAYNGGSWNGTGIKTSLSVVVGGQFDGKLAAIGYGEASVVGGAASSSTENQVDDTSVIMMYTFAGDTDLDGDVDLDDIGIWALNFTGELTDGSMVWTQGDWDYDGDVDLDDVGKWSQGFTGELGGTGMGPVLELSSPIDPQARAALRALGIIAVVPEPAVLGMALLSLSLAGRRRRSR